MKNEISKPMAFRTVMPEDPLPFNEWVEKLGVSSRYISRHIDEMVNQDDLIREQIEKHRRGEPTEPILSGVTPIKIRKWDE